MPGPTWLNDIDALSITLAVDVDFRAGLQGLGGQVVREFQATFGDVTELGMQFDRLGGYDVVIEPNGWILSSWARQFTRPGGRLLNIFWNVNGNHRIVAAEAGQVVRYREPGDVGEDQGRPLPGEAGLSFDMDDEKWWFTTMRRSMVALLERTSGGTIDEPWLLQVPRPTWELVAPPTTA
jgi:hypothetical protein